MLSLSPDLVNAAYEALGGTVIAANTAYAWRVGEIKGVSKPLVWFFWTWGIWNLFYYPHLGQLYSFGCAAFLSVANTWWLYTVYRLRKD